MEKTIELVRSVEAKVTPRSNLKRIRDWNLSSFHGVDMLLVARWSRDLPVRWQYARLCDLARNMLQQRAKVSRFSDECRIGRIFSVSLSNFSMLVAGESCERVCCYEKLFNTTTDHITEMFKQKMFRECKLYRLQVKSLVYDLRRYKIIFVWKIFYDKVLVVTIFNRFS